MCLCQSQCLFCVSLCRALCAVSVHTVVVDKVNQRVPHVNVNIATMLTAINIRSNNLSACAMFMHVILSVVVPWCVSVRLGDENSCKNAAFDHYFNV